MIAPVAENDMPEDDDGSMSDLSTDADFKAVPKALRRSWIWNHGKLFLEFNHGKQDPRWSCDRCANTRNQCSWSVTSSTWIANHLKAVHKIMKVPALASYSSTNAST